MAGSEIDSHIHRYVISTKVQRQLSGKKDSFFYGAGTIGYPYTEKKNLILIHMLPHIQR